MEYNISNIDTFLMPGDDVEKNTYIGIDAGVASMGIAVTNLNYEVIKVKNKPLWMTGLFPEGNTSEKKRNARNARRRLDRKQERLLLLRSLLGEEINKVDPYFFHRLDNSFYKMEDKDPLAGPYNVFNDKSYTDVEYYKDFPTIYHLRKFLIETEEKPDIRLVYMALSYMMKHRGHFLYESDNNGDVTLDGSFDMLTSFLYENFDIDFEITKRKEFFDILVDSSINLTNKKKILKAIYGKCESYDNLNIAAYIDFLAGAKVAAAKLFNDKELKDKEPKSISLQDSFEEKYDEYSSIFDEDRLDLIRLSKLVFDSARLAQILGDNTYICEAKVELYDKNKNDLARLKEYVLNKHPEKYHLIFHQSINENKANDGRGKIKSVNNFVLYNKGKIKHEDFCKFLLAELPELEHSDIDTEKELYRNISEGNFYTRLKNPDNSIIPHQLVEKEFIAILNNVEKWYDFISVSDADGLTVKDKIFSVFNYRIPYFVGPLNKKSEKAWVERKPEKIYPWNFDEIVDKEKSSEYFMERLVGRCSFTGSPVLPKDSLLYSNFMLLNELNMLKIDGQPLSTKDKHLVYDKLFCESKESVTEKRLKEFLVSINAMSAGQTLSGLDGKIKTKLRSYHDFKLIIEKTGSTDIAEEIITEILVCSGDKALLSAKLKKRYPILSEKDIEYICRLRYKGWGNLSREFLTEIHSLIDNEYKSVIEAMWENPYTLSQIMANEHSYRKQAEELKYGNIGYNETLDDYLDRTYAPAPVKRTVINILKAVEEYICITKTIPNKIFVETTRHEGKKEKTSSRKDKLLKLYKDAGFNKGEYSALYESLLNETNNSLKSEKLYLWYLQLGCDMYTGEPISRDDLFSQKYEIDHIHPKSKTRDNDINKNLVLVNRPDNLIKGDRYPIPENIRHNQKVKDLWNLLKMKKFINQEKYNRLTRSNPLTEEELTAFIARQLNETSQINLILSKILEERYGKYGCKIVLTKASNTSEFKKQQKITDNLMIPVLDNESVLSAKDENGRNIRIKNHADPIFSKNRNINDLHHAKDAYLAIVVGNSYHTKYTEYIERKKSVWNPSLNTVFNYDIRSPRNHSIHPCLSAWISSGLKRKFITIENEDDLNKRNEKATINTVREHMARNDITFRRIPYEIKGALFDLNIVSKGNNLLPIKKGLDVAKYGGYNMITGTYFFVVEHDIKGKRVRSIKPVYLHAKKLYESDPVKYCIEELLLVNPKIVAKKILFDSLLEIDGTLYHISGRTADRLRVKNAYQFKVEPEKYQYIKMCSIAAEKNKEIDGYKIPASYGITKDRNIVMYDYLIERMRKRPYKEFCEITRNTLQDKRTNFEKLPVEEQCDVICQITKSFSCSPVYPNLTRIGGPASSGEMTISATISNYDSVYLIHQSFTGYYEKRVNLLK